MRRSVIEFAVDAGLASGAIASIGVLWFLYGPYISTLTEMPVNVSDKNFALIAERLARRGLLLGATAGSVLTFCLIISAYVYVRRKRKTLNVA